MTTAAKRRELLVLGALRRHTELTGAQLHEITRIWLGRLYPVLSKLEADGEIVGEWVEGPYPRPRRYRLPETMTPAPPG
jgi:DNA-binding PadR family transcriptional regulator